MKEKLKKLWIAIDGKKTIIGIGLHTAWFIANMVLPELSTENEALVGHGLIGTITGVGVGHKVSKAIDKANKK